MSLVNYFTVIMLRLHRSIICKVITFTGGRIVPVITYKSIFRKVEVVLAEADIIADNGLHLLLGEMEVLNDGMIIEEVEEDSAFPIGKSSTHYSAPTERDLLRAQSEADHRAWFMSRDPGPWFPQIYRWVPSSPIIRKSSSSQRRRTRTPSSQRQELPTQHIIEPPEVDRHSASRDSPTEKPRSWSRNEGSGPRSRERRRRNYTAVVADRPVSATAETNPQGLDLQTRRHGHTSEESQAETGHGRTVDETSNDLGSSGEWRAATPRHLLGPGIYEKAARFPPILPEYSLEEDRGRSIVRGPRVPLITPDTKQNKRKPSQSRPESKHINHMRAEELVPDQASDGDYSSKMSIADHEEHQHLYSPACDAFAVSQFADEETLSLPSGISVPYDLARHTRIVTLAMQQEREEDINRMRQRERSLSPEAVMLDVQEQEKLLKLRMTCASEAVRYEDDIEKLKQQLEQVSTSYQQRLEEMQRRTANLNIARLEIEDQREWIRELQHRESRSSQLALQRESQNVRLDQRLRTVYQQVEMAHAQYEHEIRMMKELDRFQQSRLLIYPQIEAAFATKEGMILASVQTDEERRALLSELKLSKGYYLEKYSNLTHNIYPALRTSEQNLQLGMPLPPDWQQNSETSIDLLAQHASHQEIMGINPQEGAATAGASTRKNLAQRMWIHLAQQDTRDVAGPDQPPEAASSAPWQIGESEDITLINRSSTTPDVSSRLPEATPVGPRQPSHHIHNSTTRHASARHASRGRLWNTGLTGPRHTNRLMQADAISNPIARQTIPVAPRYYVRRADLAGMPGDRVVIGPSTSVYAPSPHAFQAPGPVSRGSYRSRESGRYDYRRQPAMPDSPTTAARKAYQKRLDDYEEGNRRQQVTVPISDEIQNASKR